MKIEKTCKTCEYCFKKENKRTCANVYYGEIIEDFKTERECWKIGMEYWCELENKLNDEEYAILSDMAPPSYKKRAFKELNVKTDEEYLLKLISLK